MGNEERFSFMEEEVMESRRPRRELATRIRLAISSGIVFGLMAGLAFCMINYLAGTFSPKEENDPFVFQSTPEPSEEPEENGAAEPPTEQGQTVLSVDLDSMQTMYSQMAHLSRRCRRSLVGIRTYDKEEGYNELELDNKVASGVVIAETSRALLILTTQHAVNRQDGIRVTLGDGTSVDAELYAEDTLFDLAVVRIKKNMVSDAALDKVDVIKLGDSKLFGVGMMVFAFGCPTGELYSAEFGYLTGNGTQHNIQDYQIDMYTTSMDYHRSGNGFICSTEGELLGIICEKGSSEENCSFYGISKLRRIIENLINQTEQNYSGITAREIPADIMAAHNLRGGIYVTEVSADSPAYDAGILVGNVILALDGEPVTSVVNYYQLLQQYENGKKISVTVVSDPFGSPQEKKLTLRVEKR